MMKLWRKSLPIILCWLTACSTSPPAVENEIDQPYLHEIMGEFSSLTEPTEVLELNDGLRSFVDAHVDKNWSAKMKLDMLRKMIFSDDMLDLQYDTTRTRTAIETFEARRGNCLSMTNLFIAMARYAELDANYHIVPTLPWWDRKDDMMIWNEHINAIGELRNNVLYVLDFIPEPPTALDRKDKTVSDRYAQALYHNNLGAEAIVSRQHEEALKQLRIALAIEPGLANIWNNMGILQRRLGRDDLTEASLRHAISLQPRHYSAMSNLVGFYERQNHLQQAEYYRNKIKRHRSSNPYYQYSMSSKALDEGDYKLAIRKLKRAIRLGNNEPKFYHLLHVAYERSGNTKKSLENLRLANYYMSQQTQSQPGSIVRVISDPEADRFSIGPRIILNFR